MAHVVEELLAQGKRLLVLSTTHAAVDQALAQMAARTSLAEAIGRGELLRLGHTEGDTHGAGAREVLARLHGGIAATIERARTRLRQLEAPLRRAQELEARLRERNSDAPVEIARRLTRAREEISAWRQYDYLIINRDVKEAVDQLATVIQAERWRTSRLTLKFPDVEVPE